MVRFIGVDLPRNKKVAYGLAYIHGIGIKTAKEIVKLANINFQPLKFLRTVLRPKP